MHGGIEDGFHRTDTKLHGFIPTDVRIYLAHRQAWQMKTEYRMNDAASLLDRAI
jgi:hypothetical protein